MPRAPATRRPSASTRATDVNRRARDPRGRAPSRPAGSAGTGTGGGDAGRGLRDGGGRRGVSGPERRAGRHRGGRRCRDEEYAHVNSLQAVDGGLVASFRGCSQVLRIDGATGEVLWRVGDSMRPDAEWTAAGPRRRCASSATRAAASAASTRRQPRRRVRPRPGRRHRDVPARARARRLRPRAGPRRADGQRPLAGELEYRPGDAGAAGRAPRGFPGFAPSRRQPRCRQPRLTRKDDSGTIAPLSRRATARPAAKQMDGRERALRKPRFDHVAETGKCDVIVSTSAERRAPPIP